MEPPSKFAPPAAAFRHVFEVPQGDIDFWGHVNNVAWVKWVQDVAVAHSAAVGLDVPDYLELGLAWVVRRHEVEYLLPGFAGEQLEGLTWVASIGVSSSERRVVFRRILDGANLVRASTLWVMVDRSGRPRRIPDEVRRPFEHSVST